MSTKKSLPLSASTGTHRPAVAGLVASHHAFVVECGGADAFKQLVRDVADVLRADGAVVDVWQRAYRVLQIQDSETKEWYVDEIQTRARDRVESGAVRLVALFAGRITAEAQNALLKVLEEPADSTKIFLGVPSVAELLPTIRSRVISLEPRAESRESRLDAQKAAEPKQEGRKSKKVQKVYTAAEIIALPKKDRLEALEDMLEEKDIARMRALVRACMDTLDVQEREGVVDAKQRVSLQTKFAHIDTVLAHGAAPKLLIQTVVLLMP